MGGFGIRYPLSTLSNTSRFITHLDKGFSL
uniref:Uncharacterized protein n=1 Tax=Ciona savignyi TaxID=51511 RepID=H2YKU8_CIOSA